MKILEAAKYENEVKAEFGFKTNFLFFPCTSFQNSMAYSLVPRPSLPLTSYTDHLLKCLQRSLISKY